MAESTARYNLTWLYSPGILSDRGTSAMRNWNYGTTAALSPVSGPLVEATARRPASNDPSISDSAKVCPPWALPRIDSARPLLLQCGKERRNDRRSVTRRTAKSPIQGFYVHSTSPGPQGDPQRRDTNCRLGHTSPTSDKRFPEGAAANRANAGTRAHCPRAGRHGNTEGALHCFRPEAADSHLFRRRLPGR